MNEIGGYFELELNKGEEYHSNAKKLNLGRTAFEYVLRAKKIKKVFLPYYTCDVVLEPVLRTGITYEFYHIDENLEPVFKFSSLNETDYFLYTNYFGLKDQYVRQLARIVDNLIIDNSQAFFSMPVQNVDTFYSPRKFFGLPDGAYLYTSADINIVLEKDNSLDRFEHLLGRIEDGPEEFYSRFLINDRSLMGQSIKLMSNITQAILKSIDYMAIAEKRISNFNYLQNSLGTINECRISNELCQAPMVYPYMNCEKNLRSHLIENKIFVAQYWPNLIESCDDRTIEKKFAQNLICLPIDQRYSNKEMQTIIDLIFKYV
jgi:hypothetical protein